MPKAKPYSGSVDDNLATQLLNSAGVSTDAVPLGKALKTAAATLADLVEQANATLENNEFAAIVAEHLANKLGRRGHAQIFVSDSGGVVLEITYEEQPKRRARPERTSSVPLMDDLKAKAEELGVDISEFGIKRKKIHEYLEKVEAGEIKPPKKGKGSSGKKSKKPGKSKAPKPEVQTANDPPEEDLGPMSAGPDETRVSAPPEGPKPPTKGFVKTSQAISAPVVVDIGSAESKRKKGANDAAKPTKSQEEPGKRRSMRDMVQEAGELSITDLLSSETPE